MYLRTTTVRRANRIYRYAQLVESFRRPDGTPTNRVLASFGALDDVTIANLKAALGASRQGRSVVVPEAALVAGPVSRVMQNLQYLDIAVLLRLWHSLGLPGLLHTVMPATASEVAAEDVVTALVLQRCVAPGSKLSAVRWYPRTALPELQRIEPARFHNTRIHHVLADLETVEDDLRSRLPGLVEAQEGAFTTLIIDATDTWYVGRGAPLAAMGKDKEGVFRRRVGLVLLCDGRGYPLRWHTLSGRYHDPTVLLEMAKEIVGLDWVGTRPVVLDRAVGNAGAVEQLVASGLHFVTAVPSGEFASSGAPIPWESLASLQTNDVSRAADEVDAAAEAVGMSVVKTGRYVLDLGVFDKGRSKSTPTQTRAGIAMEVVRYLTDRAGDTNKAIAAALGCTTRCIQRYRPLCNLMPALQERARSGDANGLDIDDLKAIAGLPTAEQAAAFDQAVSRRPPDHPLRAMSYWKGLEPPLLVRGVLLLDVVRAQEKRKKDEDDEKRVRGHVNDLNRRLASPSNRRSDGSALAEAAGTIKKRKMGDVLSVRLEKTDGRRTVVLERNEVAWKRRRQGDGLTLLISHPKVEESAAGLVQLYFSKDAVEKDFQTIKGVIEFRPLRHRTDVKLRAHVTICVLALLLVRALGARLAQYPSMGTVQAALDTLETAYLNRMDRQGTTLYSVTQPVPDQLALLARLGLEDLVRDQDVAATITPR